jgi:hypothetical protein
MRHSRISYRCAVLRTSWLGCAFTRTASAWQGELRMMSPVDVACNEIIPQDELIVGSSWKIVVMGAPLFPSENLHAVPKWRH